MAKFKIPHSEQHSLPFSNSEKFCIQCGAVFYKRQTQSKRSWAERKFCSRRCGVIHHSKVSIPRMVKAREGKPSWNRGQKISEHHRQALSLVRKGKPYTAERRQKMFARIRCVRGEEWQPNHLHALRDSLFYKNWRRSVFERDSFRCVLCGYQSCKRVNGKSDIQADHIKPFSIIIQEHGLTTYDDALQCDELWDVANGRTLCIPCHRKTPTYGRNVLYQAYSSRT